MRSQFQAYEARQARRRFWARTIVSVVLGSALVFLGIVFVIVLWGKG